MQILKRLVISRHTDKKKAQNLVEFSFVLPILIFLTLTIFEVALFWQDLNSIYDLNAEINANAALLDTSNMALGSTCPAATDALAIMQRRASMISLNNPTYTMSIEKDSNGNAGKEPFALYKYTSNTQVNGHPQVTMWINCTNPFENGITTQIEFYHKTMIMKASIPRFDKPDPIVIIPDNIFIASPKLNTIRHY